METEPFGTQVGQAVRRRREALGMSLETLAERASLTPKYIDTIECGKRDPSLSTILKFASALEILPADLFGSTEDLSPIAAEAYQLLMAAPPGVQKAIRQILLQAK